MDQYNRIRDEYQQIQQRRKLWSGFIIDWLKVMIPIGGALFGFFSFLSRWQPSSNLPVSWLLPILGWLIFVIPMFTWRIVAHHISRQITIMYPRMLELEQRLGWEVDTIYYLNNLSPSGRNVLNDVLRTPINDMPERRNYRLYRQACQGMRIDPHGLLLHIWEQQGYHSVGSRGHTPQDVTVFLVSIVTLSIAWFLASSLTCQQSQAWVNASGGILAIGAIVVTLLIACPRWPWN